MRATITLLALTLVAGCRSATAPTPAAESMRYGVPGAPQWLRRHYNGNDRFPDLADLTYHRVGDQIELVARFVSPPAPIGEQWFGNIRLGDATEYPFDVDQSLGVYVNFQLARFPAAPPICGTPVG